MTTQQIYHFIRQQIETRGFPPTVEEIAQSCQLALSEVEDTLTRLEQRRQIVRLAGKARGIRLPDMDRRWWIEEQVYRFILCYHQQWNRFPSLYQIAEACGLGSETVAGYIYQLYTSGRIHGLSVGGMPATAVSTAQSA